MQSRIRQKQGVNPSDSAISQQDHRLDLIHQKGKIKTRKEVTLH